MLLHTIQDAREMRNKMNIKSFDTIGVDGRNGTGAYGCVTYGKTDKGERLNTRESRARCGLFYYCVWRQRGPHFTVWLLRCSLALFIDACVCLCEREYAWNAYGAIAMRKYGARQRDFSDFTVSVPVQGGGRWKNTTERGKV